MGGHENKAELLSLCLENIILDTIEPDDRVKHVHNAMVEALMEDLRVSLPLQHPIFKDCQVKMFGSVANGTKVREMDEYDINIILKSSFDPKSTRIQFNEEPSWGGNSKSTKPDAVDIIIETSFIEKSQYINNIPKGTFFPVIAWTQPNVDYFSHFTPYTRYLNPESIVKTVKSHELEWQLSLLPTGRLTCYKTRNIISSAQVAKIFLETMKKLLHLRNDVLGSTTWRHSVSPISLRSPIKLEVPLPETEFMDVLTASTSDGNELFVFDLGFSVDLACGMELPIKCLKREGRSGNFDQKVDKETQLVSHLDSVCGRLKDKVSPENKSLFLTFHDPRKENTDHKYRGKSYYGLDDWVLGFGHYEECLMSTEKQAKNCLKLLKYFAVVNKPNLPVWSFFLKTLVMDLILKPPYKGFWESPLFSIFWQSLANLCYYLEEEHCEELCDIFVNSSVLLITEEMGEDDYLAVKKKKKSIMQNSHKFLKNLVQCFKHHYKHSKVQVFKDFLKFSIFKISKHTGLLKTRCMNNLFLKRTPFLHMVVAKNRQVWIKRRTKKYLPNSFINIGNCVRVRDFVRTRDRVTCQKWTCARISITEMDFEKGDIWNGKENQEFWERYLWCQKSDLPNKSVENLQEMLMLSSKPFSKTYLYDKKGYIKGTLMHLMKAKCYIYICNKLLAKKPDWDEFLAQNFSNSLMGCPLPPPKDHPAWIGEWLMLDCDADWIQCSGRFFDHMKLWREAGMETTQISFQTPIFPDNLCMGCLSRSEWKLKICAEYQMFLDKISKSGTRKRSYDEIMMENMLEFYHRFGEKEEDLEPVEIRKLVFGKSRIAKQHGNHTLIEAVSTLIHSCSEQFDPSCPYCRKRFPLCSYCAENKEISQEHCIECPALSELRKGLNLNNIMDLVVFFRRLFSREGQDVYTTTSHNAEG